MRRLRTGRASRLAVRITTVWYPGRLISGGWADRGYPAWRISSPGGSCRTRRPSCPGWGWTCARRWKRHWTCRCICFFPAPPICPAAVPAAAHPGRRRRTHIEAKHAGPGPPSGVFFYRSYTVRSEKTAMRRLFPPRLCRSVHPFAKEPDVRKKYFFPLFYFFVTKRRSQQSYQ